jgi:hypothetical protein
MNEGVLWPVGVVALTVAVSACSDEEEEGQTASLFSESTRTVVLEVDYATGAEPYTGEAGALGDLWDLFGENAERLFNGTKTVQYPRRLDEMEELNDIQGSSFSADDILAIAERHRDELGSGSTATFYAVWLDGFFRDQEGVRTGVIGVSIGSTGVVAMFKPVIESIAVPGGGNALERFAEQTTLVHEFGHAVGLVNNGVPLTSDHQDVENGAHCTNDDCVMYWANEGLRDLVPFVQEVLRTGSTLLFGPECLDDVDALTGS